MPQEWKNREKYNKIKDKILDHEYYGVPRSFACSDLVVEYQTCNGEGMTLMLTTYYQTVLQRTVYIRAMELTC